MGFERWARLVREYTQQQADTDTERKTEAHKGRGSEADPERQQRSSGRAAGVQKGTDESEQQHFPER